jgi:HK97 family phage prohead protease
MHLRSISMEIRAVDAPERTITGVVAPYDETSHMVIGGERILRNAFNRSITQRAKRIPLCVNHDHSTAVGFSREWQNTDEGLIGTFGFRQTDLAERALADATEGVYPEMSIGFFPLAQSRASDGVMEVREGRLIEVSLVLAGAYEGAQVLGVREINELASLLQPFSNPPRVDLSPIAPFRV